jgi:toxin ParE1/3/4
MKLPVRRTRRAEADLDEIWLHIALDNVTAADRLMEQIEAAEDRVAEFPQIGQARPEIRPDLRHWPVGAYLIFYRVDEDEVSIVRVAHGARDLPELFIQPTGD